MRIATKRYRGIPSVIRLKSSIQIMFPVSQTPVIKYQCT